MSKKTEEMKEVRDGVFNLKESPLYEYRTENNYFPVIGEGSHDAEIMLVGEAPGLNEAKTGRPFCGRAGEILDELLDHIKIPREEVYITNILKDRPQKNRDPLPKEIEIYTPFLERQIEIIEPKVIATLGRYAMEFILKKFDVEGGKISDLHGTTHLAEAPHGEIEIAVLYHPAVAVYNSNMKDALKKDFEILKDLV